MKNKTIKFFSLLAFAGLVFTMTGCDEEEVTEPDVENEEELITSVELTFTNAADANDVNTFKFADPDGEGGEAPTQFDTIFLSANTTYALAVKFLDESDANDVEDITEEVKEEDDEHLVCYSVHGGTTVTITDQDGGGLDLGLMADIVTSDAGDGHLTVSLKHQPDVKDGSCDVGETDVEVRFELKLK